LRLCPCSKLPHDTRHPNHQLSRGQLIALTPKGRTLQKEMWPAYREAVKKQLNALTKRQIEDLSKLLGLLIRNQGE
jgi:DNA-binding MarR family transcriptional regulator